MTDNRAPVSRWAIRGLYLFTFVLVFWPLADLISNTWPLQLSSLPWRYGFMGLLAGFLHTPILGLALAMCLAYALQHERTLLMISVCGFIGASILLVVLLFFPLDVLQIRNTVQPEGLPSFQVGALMAELKHFTSFLVLLLLGMGGWKTVARTLTPDSKSSAGPSSIVMKSSDA